MKHLLKNTLILLSLALSTALLTSCASGPETPEETPEEQPAVSESVAEELPAEEPQVDYGGTAEEPAPPAAAQPAPVAQPAPPPPAPEKAAPVAKSPEPKAAPAAKSKFKPGFYTFAKACVMRTKADAKSKGAGNVAKGKKLWLDPHNAQWMKAHKKSGNVYVPTSCLK